MWRLKYSMKYMPYTLSKYRSVIFTCFLSFKFICFDKTPLIGVSQLSWKVNTIPDLGKRKIKFKVVKQLSQEEKHKKWSDQDLVHKYFILGTSHFHSIRPLLLPKYVLLISMEQFSETTVCHNSPHSYLWTMFMDTF